MLTITGGFLLIGYLCYPIYEKWQDSPTILFLESTSYPIENIDFPGITICSNDKVMNWQLKEAMKEEPWKTLSYDYPYLFEYLRKVIEKLLLPHSDLTKNFRIIGMKMIVFYIFP